MSKRTISKSCLPLRIREIVEETGYKVKVARKRRGYTQEKLAKLALTTRGTIQRIEKGDPGVSFGILCHILWALRLENDLAALTDTAMDESGLAIADSNLPTRVREKEDDSLDF